MDGDTAITNFNLKVEEEVEDDWGDTDWETMTANGDGSYTLSKYGTYRYSVTAEGYKDVKMFLMHQPDQKKRLRPP